MSKSARVIIALVAVIVIAGGAVLLLNNKKEAVDSPNTLPRTGTPSDSDSESADQPATTESSVEAAPQAATVTYTDAGFGPKSITVASGGTITFVNQTDAEVKPASDPHPVHTNNPELNADDIAPGQSKTITVTTKGTWGVHNHHDEDMRMTVIVK